MVASERGGREGPPSVVGLHGPSLAETEYLLAFLDGLGAGQPSGSTLAEMSSRARVLGLELRSARVRAEALPPGVMVTVARRDAPQEDRPRGWRVLVRNGRHAGELGRAHFRPTTDMQNPFTVRLDDGACLRLRLEDFDIVPDESA